jgi:hypothetical protein
VIGFAGQKRPGFELADVGFGCGEFAVEVFQKIVALLGVGFFRGEAYVSLDVTGDRRELSVRVNLFFSALAVAKNSLRFFLVIPKVGLSNAGFERFQTFAVLGRVKDNSGRARCGV